MLSVSIMGSDALPGGTVQRPLCIPALPPALIFASVSKEGPPSRKAALTLTAQPLHGATGAGGAPPHRSRLPSASMQDSLTLNDFQHSCVTVSNRARRRRARLPYKAAQTQLYAPSWPSSGGTPRIGCPRASCSSCFS